MKQQLLLLQDVEALGKKGRVERNHGTHQDRLIKKLRRRGIASDEAANQFLQDESI